MPAALPVADLGDDLGQQVDGGQRVGVAGVEIGGAEAAVVGPAEQVEQVVAIDRGVDGTVRQCPKSIIVIPLPIASYKRTSPFARKSGGVAMCVEIA